jgi:hypothetical protein
MTKTITKIKYDEGLRWLPFNNLHATTNQKHAGVMEGGWDRPRDRARTLGERDSNDEPLAEGDKDDDNEYGEDGNIPNDDDEYAIGVDGVGEPLEEGDDQHCSCTKVPCKSAAERALKLRASYSQRAALRV